MLADLLRPELKAVRSIDDPDFRIKAFKIDQWSFRRTMASLRSYQLGAFPRLPFYDTRLSDFFATVPSEFVAGRRLQIDYLKRYAPDLARIAWQAGGANLYQYRSARYWKLPIRVAARRTVSSRVRRSSSATGKSSSSASPDAAGSTTGCCVRVFDSTNSSPGCSPRPARRLSCQSRRHAGVQCLDVVDLLDLA